MPSLGLLLEQPIFGSYNSRVAAINEKFEPSNPEYRPPIDFEIHQDAMVQFRQKYIYDNMREVEDRTGLYAISQPSSFVLTNCCVASMHGSKQSILTPAMIYYI